MHHEPNVIPKTKPDPNLNHNPDIYIGYIPFVLYYKQQFGAANK